MISHSYVKLPEGNHHKPTGFVTLFQLSVDPMDLRQRRKRLGVGLVVLRCGASRFQWLKMSQDDDKMINAS